jgi:hypothetical protein
MGQSFRFRLLTSCVVAGAAVAGFFGLEGPAGPAERAAPSHPVYHADPQHLWNRLHAALFTRIGPDGHTYGRDRIEPLLWLGSRHLLQGPSHERAVQLLNEFLARQGEEQVGDPLKRALLQRDLWMVYSWLEGDHAHGGNSGVPAEKLGQARQRLGRPLAAAIRRLALSPEQIQKLPDTYADAVKSGRFARSPAAERPDKPYLPPDLFAADGPWVGVGRAGGPVATQHLAKENTLANSAFLIFLRLPGGRAAARRFLARGTDTLPAGAEVALVRRALLVAAPGEVAPTRLIESVQLRIYGETGQAVSEFRLCRGLLFGGRAGGLRAVGPKERDFKTGFAGSTWDPLEEPLVRQELTVRQLDIRNECTGCHNRDRFPGLRARESGPLVGVAVADAIKTAVQWKRQRPDWKALRKLLAK